MLDLEVPGLIYLPHKSVGRVPKVSGYRFFVDSLFILKPLGSTAVNQLNFDAFSQKQGVIHLLDQCLAADGV